MCFAYWRAPRGKRAALAVAVTLVGAFLFMSVADAEARTRKRVRHNGAWQAGFAAIVVDAKTGKVLDDQNPDALRHPASLTKIMTLYLLFEQVEQGKLHLKSRLNVSEYASERPPTKLGLQEGTTIAVEDAIKALITRSANDVATVVAENIADDEENFAVLMTRKARALGMTNTVFKNASGLPDREQVTTARDMAILGRAIQDRFPSLYRFFSTQSFVWRGRVIANHNRLLGRVAGVDGIKTGYTNASGFNLVTSVRHKNRHIVAVVLGGRTGASRDHYMRELISDNLDDAFTGNRTSPLVVEAPTAKPQQTAQVQRPQQAALVQAPQNRSEQKQRTTRTPRAKLQTVVVAGSNEPIRPIAVKTMPVDAEGKIKDQKTVSASLFALPFSNFNVAHAVPMPMTGGTGEQRPLVADTAPEVPAQAQASVINNEAKPQPLTDTASAQTAAVPAQELSETEELEIEARVLASVRGENKADALPASAAPAPQKKARRLQVASTSSIPVSAPAAEDDGDPLPAAAKIGWSIQIGAYPDAKQARERLDDAKESATAVLARTTAYTEKVSKGSNNLFRAKFAGFQTEWQARRACQTLQRSKFDCIVAKN
jgi:D-alanyl-D-alanine carboxypeptidase